MGVTERTFYPALLRIISEKGGSGVAEVQYDSVPDIEFSFLGRRWLLSVKIGESPNLMKDAFVQYLRHKEESGMEYGLLLVLPESMRKTKATEEAVTAAVRHATVGILVDAGPVKDEYRDRTFADILDLLRLEVAPLVEQGIPKHYPLPLVVSFLRAQVLDVMSGLSLGEEAILRIVTDRKLLSDLGSLSKQEVEDVAKFLAAYIVLSQVLFLRLFAAVHPSILPGRAPITRTRLRQAFKKVLNINYRPIFELDVLNAVGEDYLRDTFDLIWGLEVERVRHELPGRIFHELMPPRIRKLLAAFYTRPQAAEMLARLTVKDSDAAVFDPASGSGTILVSAYRAKHRLYERERKPGNPHKKFCEEDIFAADIMPFAVHLTSANLAAMDVAETIDRTQVIQGDSIELVAGIAYKGSLQLSLFGAPRKARTTAGEEYDVTLDTVDAILMNPPFTKVERGIQDYVNMTRFKQLAGGEVGLWGHFVFLANQFLREGGLYGAVLPINILRGRESARVRAFLFREWTVQYVLKATLNYGFSEWAEYRDILLVARKERPSPEHRVRFVLVKKDLTALSEDDIAAICDNVERESFLRSKELDVDNHPLHDLDERFMNLMWFCGVSDLAHRDILVKLFEMVKPKLGRFPEGYFREGYRPVPQGVSDFLFATRATDPSRVEYAFLRFTKETAREVKAATELGTEYLLEKDALTKSLRTPVGLRTMDISGSLDYIAHEPYSELKRVKRAGGFNTILPSQFWSQLQTELRAVSTGIVTMNRINPYSPNTHLIAFVSQGPLSPSNQLNVVMEPNLERAKALCVLVNSWPFFCQFFLLKEESTGRFMHIRFYDLYEMVLYPPDDLVKSLARLFDKYRDLPFPSLREQFDARFDDRYDEFYNASATRSVQTRLWSVLNKPIDPWPPRVRFDLEVGKALGAELGTDDLLSLYATIVKEMIITRGLKKD